MGKLYLFTPPLEFFTGRMPFLPPNQQRQSTEGKSTELEQRADDSWQLLFRRLFCSV